MTGYRLVDAERGGDCVLIEWSDGVRRCTPVTSVVADPLPRVVFTDAACTSSIGRTPTFPVELVFLGAETAGGFQPSHLFQAGRIASRPEITYELRGDVCVQLPVDTNHVYVELARELPPATLGEFTTTTLPASGRLAHVVETSGDGASIWRGYHDHELDAPCGPEYGPHGSFACAPRDSHPIEHFADAACSEPAVLVPAADPSPRFAFASSETTWCTDHFELGDRFDGAVFQRAGDRCVQIEPGDASSHRIGRALALAPLDQRVPASDRRLQELVLTNDDLTSPSMRLIDSAFGAECSAFPFGDRCMPSSGAAIYEEYVTPACDVKVKIAMVAEQLCVPAIPLTTDGFVHYEIGAPITVYRGADCSPRGAPEGYGYHSLGPPLAADRFAPAAFVVDP